jgi:predicted DCC family thiol-disulfide oxidoreductase YuxK
MKNQWSGGQYSFFRFALGIFLLLHFVLLSFGSKEALSNTGARPREEVRRAFGEGLVHLFDSSSPAIVTAALLCGAMLSALFAVGKFDRPAATILCILWANFVGSDPLATHVEIPLISLLLLAHALLPSAPFGSIAAIGRVDPKGTWRMSPRVFGAAWALLALGTSYSGTCKFGTPSWIDGSALRDLLQSPLARPTALREWLLSGSPIPLELATWSVLGLQLLFAPLAVFSRARPWIWLGIVGMQLLQILLLVDLDGHLVGLLWVYFFVFDPGWIPPPKAGRPDVLFYDGTCGLCHRTVRLVLAEDSTGDSFQFAALDSKLAREVFPAPQELPDSLVVLTAEGRHLTRSSAVLRVLSRLGGLWRLVAVVLLLMPTRIRNSGYDLVAAIRHKIFRRPTTSYPLRPTSCARRWLP